MSEARRASAVVVIPTYNERETLRTVVEGVLAVPDLQVLVVDDNSPDGTGRLADELAAERGRVAVLHREGPGGLGPAYLAGFAAALARGADAVCQMDADGSHDPSDLRPLIAALAGADVVLGSRYIPGSHVHDWPTSRRLLSRAGNTYVRAVSGLAVRDITTGFRAWRGTALRGLPLSRVRSRGHGFQVEMAMLAAAHRLAIAEVPIAFQDRQRGASKLDARTLLEFLRSPWHVAAR